MRYKRTIVVGIITLLAALGTTASAENWSFRAGLQYWMPDWKYDKSVYDYDGDTDGVYGPVLFVGYKNFGLGINYYTGTFDVKVEGETQEKDRTDYDIYMTYRFLKYFNAILGYKVLDFEKGESIEYNLETKVDGFALGIAAGYPIGTTNIFVYGNGFYLPALTGDEEWVPQFQGGEHIKYDVDADGFNIEAGAGYLFNFSETVSLSVKAGYRVQRFDYEFDNEFVLPADEAYDGFRIEILGMW